MLARDSVLSPMSPTQTWWSSSGARASTSVASSPQPVTPTVLPVAGSTEKTRAVSPESLVVTTTPLTTASPLDSMMSLSWKVKTTCDSTSGAAAAPSRNGTTTSPASSRSLIEQLGQTGADPPGRDQVVVLAPQRAPGDRSAGAGRAQEGVAGGVLALDELHDVDAIALQPHEGGPQCVGERVGEPLAEDAVPGEHGVGRRSRRLAQLGCDVVVAARRGQHQRRAPLDRPGQRLVGRGVAGVQGEHHLGRRVERRAADGADHELGVQAERSGDLLVVLPGLLLDVHPDQPHG